MDHTADERRAPVAKLQNRAESPIDGINMPYLTNTEHNEHQIRVILLLMRRMGKILRGNWGGRLGFSIGWIVRNEMKY